MPNRLNTACLHPASASTLLLATFTYAPLAQYGAAFPPQLQSPKSHCHVAPDTAYRTFDLWTSSRLHLCTIKSNIFLTPAGRDSAYLCLWLPFCRATPPNRRLPSTLDEYVASNSRTSFQSYYLILILPTQSTHSHRTHTQCAAHMKHIDNNLPRLRTESSSRGWRSPVPAWVSFAPSAHKMLRSIKGRNDLYLHKLSVHSHGWCRTAPRIFGIGERLRGEGEEDREEGVIIRC